MIWDPVNRANTLPWDDVMALHLSHDIQTHNMSTACQHTFLVFNRISFGRKFTFNRHSHSPAFTSVHNNNSIECTNINEQSTINIVKTRQKCVLNEHKEQTNCKKVEHKRERALWVKDGEQQIKKRRESRQFKVVNHLSRVEWLRSIHLLPSQRTFDCVIYDDETQP